MIVTLSGWKLVTIMVMLSEPCDARRLERQQAKGELQTTEAILKLHDQTFIQLNISPSQKRKHPSSWTACFLLHPVAAKYVDATCSPPWKRLLTSQSLVIQKQLWYIFCFDPEPFPMGDVAKIWTPTCRSPTCHKRDSSHARPTSRKTSNTKSFQQPTNETTHLDYLHLPTNQPTNQPNKQTNKQNKTKPTNQPTMNPPVKHIKVHKKIVGTWHDI